MTPLIIEGGECQGPHAILYQGYSVRLNTRCASVEIRTHERGFSDA